MRFQPSRHSCRDGSRCSGSECFCPRPGDAGGARSADCLDPAGNGRTGSGTNIRPRPARIGTGSGNHAAGAGEEYDSAPGGRRRCTPLRRSRGGLDQWLGRDPRHEPDRQPAPVHCGTGQPYNSLDDPHRGPAGTQRGRNTMVGAFCPFRGAGSRSAGTSRLRRRLASEPLRRTTAAMDHGVGS